MGKRSTFERRPRDAYATPYEAVVPLLPHLRPGTRFDEPCCGDLALMRHLERHGHYCETASDIHPTADRGVVLDALKISKCYSGTFITNPPWKREILHPLISRLSAIAPTWLLFDADWIHTKQSAPFMPWLHRIVSIGRVKWEPDTTMTGKDNACWYLLDQTAQRLTSGPVFFGRGA